MKLFLIISCLLTLLSCKKYLDAEAPSNQLDGKSVYRNEATATAAVLSIYGQMESDGLFYKIITSSGLSSDELSNYSGIAFDMDLASNNLTANNPVPQDLWQSFYKYIYLANAALEGLEESPIPARVKEQLKGEALFVRALCYFYLVQYFGDVPLVLQSDYRANSVLGRAPVAHVLARMQSDLTQAIALLSPDYLTATNVKGTERVRANRYAAEALLSKFYLLGKDWALASLHASNVIAQTQRYAIQNPPDDVFLANSMEAILQLQSQVPTYNSYPGAFLILLTTPSSVSLDTVFVQSFPPSDKRRSQWISSVVAGGEEYWFPYKYKVGQNAPSVSEYTMVLRLSEQYLIRAEAKMREGKNGEAEDDLNVIRVRAGLPAVHGLSPNVLPDSITIERKRELFAEAGDRWFTLKRTGTADAILSARKGSSWSTNDQLYPIPQSERLLNLNLSQNQGY